MLSFCSHVRRVSHCVYGYWTNPTQHLMPEASPESSDSLHVSQFAHQWGPVLRRIHSIQYSLRCEERVLHVKCVIARNCEKPCEENALQERA